MAERSTTVAPDAGAAHDAARPRSRALFETPIFEGGIPPADAEPAHRSPAPVARGSVRDRVCGSVCEPAETPTPSPPAPSAPAQSTRTQSPPPYTAAGLLRGDEIQWRSFQERFERAFRAYAAQQGCDANECDDFVQSALGDLIVAMRDGRYRPERGPLAAFVFGIARHKMLAFRRSASRERAFGGDPFAGRDLSGRGGWSDAPATFGCKQAWDESVQGSAVGFCLDAMAADPRRRQAVEVFRQHVLLGVPAITVASTMRLSVMRVYKLTYRVREELRVHVRRVRIADESVWNSVSVGSGTRARARLP